MPDTPKKFVCPHQDLLVEVHGRSGNNGKFGNFTEQVNARLKRLENDMTAIKQTQTKLMLIAALGAGGGGAAVGLIAKLLG